MLQPFRLILLGVLCLPLAAFALQETWESGYSKEDATGAHVLGYWKLDGEAALKDVSGKGNDLTL